MKSYCSTLFCRSRLGRFGLHLISSLLPGLDDAPDKKNCNNARRKSLVQMAVGLTSMMRKKH